MLKFDELNHVLSGSFGEVELQPLSFNLLNLLWLNANQVVSNQMIHDQVWGNTEVSPETLKQRVFLLRKSLKDAGVEGVEIKAIRGEGYRLITTFDSKSSSAPPPVNKINEPVSNSFMVSAVVALVFISVFAVGYYLLQPQPPIPTNNRVVLWRLSQNTTLDSVYNAHLQAVKTQLLQTTEQGLLQFIEMERDLSVSINKQARQARAGLIVAVDAIGAEETRIQLLEPHTATSLYSVVLGSEGKQSHLAISSLVSAVVRLLESDKLILTKEMKTTPTHKIWLELRTIAKG